MWNAFRLHEETATQSAPMLHTVGSSSTARPHAIQSRYTNEKTIISSIYTRIALDFSGPDIRHIQLDEQDRYLKTVNSSLNTCFVLEANIDQAPRAFRKDIAMTLFDSGVAAIVPVDIKIDPDSGRMVEILNLRVGTVVEWYPKHIKVRLYNENKGLREDIVVEKRYSAIIENPLYEVMNETNSTLQRLRRKLHLLDAVDEISSSGKLDLIVQVPYTIKSEARRAEADRRRADIEFQLKGSQYGIAYTDGTEKIIQLNRPSENNLLKQVEYLTNLLYDQLGLTAAVMNGTADEATMINYFNRTIEPLLDATVESMRRSFLGVEGMEKKETIKYFRNPFKLVPIGQIAEIADKFTRNEILSSNEMRSYMGIPPSDDPKADQLINSNMPMQEQAPAGPSFEDMDRLMNDVFSGLESDLDQIETGL